MSTKKLEIVIGDEKYRFVEKYDSIDDCMYVELLQCHDGGDDEYISPIWLHDFEWFDLDNASDDFLQYLVSNLDE